MDRELCEIVLTETKYTLSQLVCKVCNQPYVNPHRFKTCGHYYCKLCISGSICLTCGITYDESNVIIDNWLPQYISSLQYLVTATEVELAKMKQNTDDEDNEIQLDFNDSKRIKCSSPFSISLEDSNRLLMSSLSDEDVCRIKKVNKPNAVGETKLHVACKKGDLDRVTVLLASGCFVNVKDYAGWTPLHEAVIYGHINIIKALLEAGSAVNAPGDLYVTPLQKAVVGNHLDIIKLLLEYGADIDIKTYCGKTAVDMANEETLPILQSASISTKNIDLAIQIYPLQCNVYIVNCTDMDLDLLDLDNITRFSVKGKFNNSITHLVVAMNDVQRISYTNEIIVLAMINQLPIMTYSWLEACACQQKYVSTEPFYISGCDRYPSSDIIYRIVDSRNQLLPKLFDGCNFYFTGFTDDKINTSKDIMERIIKAGGGHILKREPHLRTIESVKCYPWHASCASIEQCYNYIVYDVTPPMRYNMKEIRHVPLQWVFDCIWQFKLIPVT